MASFSFSSQNNRYEEGSSSYNPSRKRKIYKPSSKASSSLYTQKKVVTRSREPDIEAENMNMQGAENDERLRIWRYAPLLRATIRGDWETAEKIFQDDNSALTAIITENADTVLHVAVGTGNENIHFVEKLVELMPAEALAAANRIGRTPLHNASLVGNTKAAAILVEKYPSLIYIRNIQDFLPIHCAAISAKRETLLYLLGVTEDDGVAFYGESGVIFINNLISSNFYDIALKMVESYPHLAISQNAKNFSALRWMARKVSAFPSGSPLSFWQRLVYDYVHVKLEKCSIEGHNKTVVDLEDPLKNITHVHKDNRTQSLGEHNSMNFVPQIKHIREKKQMHVQALQLLRTLCEKITLLNNELAYPTIARVAMATAIHTGIPEIIEEIAHWFPTLIWVKDEGYTIFQRAIINRHENVFNLVHQMSGYKYLATDVLDQSVNNFLHLAGLKAPENKLRLVCGAALQMQRELQWFEEVKKFVKPSIEENINAAKETPAMVFTREHKDLVAEGEKWMKDTANSCTITAALIVTMVFAAAITVPGGNKGDTGLPIFSHKAAFIAFVVSDAIALFTSTTSLLMFLSILTSRYAEGDFLYVLPKRLILGLVTLFLSITTMMVAFGSTLYLVFGQNKAWILIPVAALACLPITSFVTLQFPLLVTLISSTYGKGIFGKQSNRVLY